MAMLHKAIKRVVVVGKFSLLPILAVLYPVLFHYANNVGNLGVLPFSRLGGLSILMVGIAVVVYVFFFVANRGRVETASNAAFIFLLFFNTYGLFYDWVHSWNLFEVHNYTLLPLFALIAIYSSWFITKLNTKRTIEFWNVAVIVLCGLMLFNAVRLIPIEFQIARARDKNAIATVNTPKSTEYNNYPDIYFIIFDEYVGFEGARQYWHYDEIDKFVEFLKSREFFIAENSHVVYAETLNSIATRLNYQDYPPDEDKQIYYEAITNNKVMAFLKSLGYTTVLFDGLNYAYSYEQPIVADYSFEPPSSSSANGFLNNEFELLVVNNTMIRPFIKFINKNNQVDPLVERNKNMIFYSRDEVSKSPQVSSPKFVYVHLMIPHSPFIFDARGNTNDPQYYKNWDYYLGNYIFATDIAKQMVTSILASADPAHPPIIILQSDHGARNGTDGYTNILENYPDKYKTLIMNALYLPGCDNTTDLKQDMKPINTFPIIFNCYFDENIPLQ